MRHFSERCLRNLQDRMIIFGFEGWDIFIVMGVALFLQTLNIHKLILWISIFATAGFLLTTQPSWYHTGSALR